MFGEIGREKVIDFEVEVLNNKGERRECVIYFTGTFSLKVSILSNFFQQLFYPLLWLFSLC